MRSQSMDEQKREVWRSPELIVIMRGRPEEAVLGACKGGPTNGGVLWNNYSCQLTACDSPGCEVLAAS
jgi:hypothetical protein